MNTIYFDENRGHVCSECAEDLGLENLPEASNDAEQECVICVFTEKRLAPKTIAIRPPKEN